MNCNPDATSSTESCRPSNFIVVEKWQKPSTRFAKSEKKLDSRARAKLYEWIDLLLEGTNLGKNLEKLDGHDNLYSARLSRSQRFVFQVKEDGTGKAIEVGNHDIYRRKWP